MGLIKSGREGVQYLKVSDGKLRIKSNEEDPNAEKRVVEMNGEKHTLYETCFNKVNGYITDVYIQNHPEYGDSLILIMEDIVNDKEEIYQLQMADSSRYFQSVIQLLPNVDFSQPVTFSPYSFTPEGSKWKSQGVTLKQDGNKIKNYYKDWNEKKQETKLKNGLQEFKFSDDLSKDEKKILRIRMTAFLKTEAEKISKKLKKFITSLEDGDTTSKNEGDDLPY